MSEQKPPSAIKILLLIVVFGALGVVVMGGLLYVGWETVGKSVLGEGDPGSWSEEQGAVVEEAAARSGAERRSQPVPDGEPFFGAATRHLAVAVEQAREASHPQRAFLSRAPISADHRIYQEHINREDVLVMVVYYADW